MPYVDDTPSRHGNISDLRETSKKKNIIKRIIDSKKRIVIFSTEELRVLLEKERTIITYNFQTDRLTRKKYKRLLELKDKARKYLAEEKTQKNNTEKLSTYENDSTL